jgi:O-antigen ligase
MVTDVKVKQLYFYILVALAVNIPGLLEYDNTRLTHDQGLLNVQTVLRICLTGIAGLLLFWGSSQERTKGYAIKPVIRRALPYVVLLVLFALSCLQVGTSRLIVAEYRVVEWTVALFVLIAIMRRTPVIERPDLLIKAVATTCLTTIAIVLIGVVVAPNLAIETFKVGGAMFDWRLGGFLVHPNRLGLAAAMAFWYAVLFLRGGKRLALSLSLLLVLILSQSRGALVGLGCTVPVLMMFGGRRQRWAAGGLLVSTIPLLFMFSDSVFEFVSRGQGEEGLATASNRASVWISGTGLFLKQPLTGYGFYEGVRQSLEGAATQAWWVPPNAHNDLLQAVLSAGILAALLVVIINYQIVRRLLALPHSVGKTFLVMMFTQLFVYSLQAPLITGEMNAFGILTIAMYLLLALPLAHVVTVGPKIEHTSRARGSAEHGVTTT